MSYNLSYKAYIKWGKVLNRDLRNFHPLDIELFTDFIIQTIKDKDECTIDNNFIREQLTTPSKIYDDKTIETYVLMFEDMNYMAEYIAKNKINFE